MKSRLSNAVYMSTSMNVRFGNKSSADPTTALEEYRCYTAISALSSELTEDTKRIR